MEKQKICAYCREPIKDGEGVQMTILVLRGYYPQPVERCYCSKKCGQYDQMANEP